MFEGSACRALCPKLPAEPRSRAALDRVFGDPGDRQRGRVLCVVGLGLRFWGSGVPVCEADQVNPQAAPNSCTPAPSP